MMEKLFESDSQGDKEIEIDLQKEYSFPENLSIIEFNDKFIIVAVDYGNWIVLENLQQVTIFNMLKENCIKTVMDSFKEFQADLEHVLMQLEARHFENTEVILKSTGEGVQLYLTNKCNLRCPHCYMISGNASPNELEKNEWYDIIENVAAHGADRITFSGGEATLHPNFAEFVIRSHNLGMNVELLSNGLLLTDKLLDNIGYALNRVQISIDGFSEETNSTHRGKGHFTKALKVVDSLLKRNIPTDIGITPPFSNDLHLHLDDYVGFIQDLYSSYKGAPLNIALTASLMEGRDLHLSEPENKYYSDCIDAISKKCFGTHYKEIGFIQFKRLFGIDDNCPYGDLHIVANGDIFFCSHVTSMKPMGNIRTSSWKEIYEKADKAKKYSNINNINPCSKCIIKYICGGNCRIDHIPDFLDCSSVPQNPSRICTKKDKEEIYKLMIDTNEYIFQ
ncbi:MAG: radical SAM protein [Bacteroides sp.]|nr:radical SAM protein [Bacteroides sp.]MBD5375568.1 radical SAM protein [Bacteroides sp.]